MKTMVNFTTQTRRGDVSSVFSGKAKIIQRDSGHVILYKKGL
jgi:hypothetical protein